MPRPSVSATESPTTRSRFGCGAGGTVVTGAGGAGRCTVGCVGGGAARAVSAATAIVVVVTGTVLDAARVEGGATTAACALTGAKFTAGGPTPAPTPTTNAAATHTSAL